jgi:tight adherence protein B
LALAALVVPVAAQGAEAKADVRVRTVDTRGYPHIRVTVVTPKVTKTAPTLVENGKAPAGLQAENLGRAKSVVLAIDRSQSMRGRPLREAVAAARAFVAAKPAADRIAVSAFATEAVMLTGFSSATIDADIALRNVREVDEVQGTKLYDDLVLAAESLAGEEYPSRVIIVVTDGNETKSTASLDDVVQAARKAHVAIYVIAIESSRFTPGPLKALAVKTGGAYHGTASAAELKGVYNSIANEFQRTWRLEYLTSARPGEELGLRVSSPGQGVATVQLALPASLGDGAGSDSGSALPDGAFSGWGTAALAFAVFFMVLLAAGLVMATNPGDQLRSRLAPHLERRKQVRREKRTGRQRLEAFTTLFTMTEQALGRTSQWVKAERLLARADVPLKTVELFYLSAASGIGIALLASVGGANAIVAFIFLVLGAGIPFGVLWYKARKRLNEFENQLPDILVSVAASLKAGHSFKQALQAVVDDGADPAAKELKRVLTESRLGRPTEDALVEMADRIGSKNFAFIVTAVNVQTQVGGSLAGLFDLVADTVRQRHQFARKIKSLTATGRMSAYVLIGLPFFVAGALTMLNGDYMSPLYNTSTGHKLIIGGLVMMGFGSLILKKIVSFKG